MTAVDGSPVPEDLLRPALEVAWATAVVGSQLRPPNAPPSMLRPLLRFQKLPAAALGTVRRAVEQDDEFRAQVAAVATEEMVGRAAWLWLHRPEGWEEELGGLAAGTRSEAGDGPRHAGGDRATAGRLAAAESRLRRLGAELEVLRRHIGRVQEARSQAESETTRSKARSDELERAAAKARGRLERLTAELADAREAAVVARAEAEALRVELDEAERKLAELDRPSHSVEPAPPPEADTITLPADALGALDGAASAASTLARALVDLTASLSAGSRSSTGADPFAVGEPTSAPAVPGPAPVGAGHAVPRRRPLRFPRGMHAGSPEANVWLLTEADARVVVDGYNVAKLGWPDHSLAEQREWLLDLLDELASRHGAAIDVVFDGADVGPVRSNRRHQVAVRFSPSSVLADDVIREMVAAHPATAPVVVVTNDRAVGHDVRALGANVVSSGGLLAVARR
jgi:predicted RNA-binding protein with PIN domain